jgi:hypothetical protein
MCVEHIEFVQSAVPDLNVMEGSCCCPFMLGKELNHSIVHYRLQTSTETKYPLPLQPIAKPVELIEDLAFKQFQFLLVCKIRTLVFLLGKKESLEERKTKV